MNAKHLKFIVICLLNGDFDTSTLDESSSVLRPLRTRDEQGTMTAACGICKENYTIGGDHNIVALPCSHTICLACANHPVFREKKQCPYCRKAIQRMSALIYDQEDDG